MNKIHLIGNSARDVEQCSIEAEYDSKNGQQRKAR